MDDSKTVRSDDIQTLEMLDPIYAKQKEGVANMRASLLACNPRDLVSTKIAIQNVTVMRLYHQINRIIKYTEMMDKIEAKLYESIDNTLENMNSSSPSTWLTLLNIQERLQDSMIKSHKLLEPYLNLELPVVEVPQPSPEDSFASMIMDQDARDKLRNSAQAVLAALGSLPGDSDG